MDKKFNLIISVSLAVCIYVLLVLGILFYLKPQKDNESKKVSMEETIIEVSIDASSNENIVEPSKNIEDIKPQELVMKQEISKSISNKSEPDVKSLFSNIKSDAPGQISKEKPSSSSSADSFFLHAVSFISFALFRVIIVDVFACCSAVLLLFAFFGATDDVLFFVELLLFCLLLKAIIEYKQDLF